MVCHNCSAEVTTEDLYCGKCGVSLRPQLNSNGTGKAGCLIGWLGLIIGFSPAIFGPMQVAAQCGANANEGNCGPYMWPLLLVMTLPIGLVMGIIGIVANGKANKGK